MSDPGRASMFGLWSAVNPTVTWLIARHPEVLVYTPREFLAGRKRRPRLDTAPAMSLEAVLADTRAGRVFDLEWREDGGWHIHSNEGSKP